MVSVSAEQFRRQNPRLVDTDWLLLKDLRAAIASHAPAITRSGATALDFGCGSRPYQSIFAAAGARYLGADFDQHGDVLIDRGGRLSAPDHSVDLVLSFQVLEHVRDLGTYFSEARRVLRPDGWLMLSTHGTWFYHPHPEDHRRWTRPGLIDEISGHGFEVIECVPIVGPLAWTTIIRLTCACYALRKIPFVGSAVAGLLAVVMNLRAWLEDVITPAWVKHDNACVYLVLARPILEVRS
jgi:SAM-dependent methyltransferase